MSLTNTLTHTLALALTHTLTLTLTLALTGPVDLRNATALDHEAATHRDILFLNASSLLGRTAGPLKSLVSWYDCSLRAFPKVQLVGKCDDDMWMHPLGMEDLLSRSLKQRDGSFPGAEVLVGRFERFVWYRNQSLPGHEGPVPAGFRGDVQTWAGCSSRPNWHDAKPFPFPKGAIFFLSSGALQGLLDTMRQHALRLVATDQTRCFRYSAVWRRNKQLERARARNETHARGEVSTDGLPCGSGFAEPLAPFEDVWTGFALDHLSKTRMLLVDLFGAGHFHDQYGFTAARTTLAWHSRVDSAFWIRAQLLQNWSASMQYCDGKNSGGCRVMCSSKSMGVAPT